MSRPAGPDWWADMARDADEVVPERFSADWFRVMRDLYRDRFPNADARSLANMDDFIRWADA